MKLGRVYIHIYALLFIHKKTKQIYTFDSNKEKVIPYSFTHNSVKLFTQYKVCLKELRYIINMNSELYGIIINTESEANQKILKCKTVNFKTHISYLDKKALIAKFKAVNFFNKKVYKKLSCILADGTNLIQGKSYYGTQTRDYYIINNEHFLKTRFEIIKE